ncbi:MAG: FAD-binding protein [Elusimicrobiaceae bacterium]|jgi:glycolate oxidase|nr:FAD-binding protein [Elusimicrobiaceae bacterium]MBT3954787.1 FAD-binding protein [Elusimicrobiaceae bacterium]MBT4008781.1 FAD-binding protein [Elusimicrobiaceae bacterium]MBT4402275.1 FAD-binding protein [Elusimicrobiaceae bacterium]MBT4440268.1 FAD-binding protein [Elusimicrobiaceae bacterium]
MSCLKHLEKELIKVAGRKAVIKRKKVLETCSGDYSLYKKNPSLVIKPSKLADVAKIIKTLYKYKTPFTPRASATDTTGGCVPLKKSVVIDLVLLNKILEINTKKGYAVVQAGVVNKNLQDKLAKLGYFYAPDPASWQDSTIGGNAANNAGGPRCLKYGVTKDHILKAELVKPNGEVVVVDNSHPNILGLIVGSEGTFGIITKLWLKILKKPIAKKTLLLGFADIHKSMKLVSEIIASGITPCAVEMMDDVVIEFAQKAAPKDLLTCKSALIIEVDGTKKEVLEDFNKILKICKIHKPKLLRTAENDEEIENIWQIRRDGLEVLKQNFKYILDEDPAVPRNKLVQYVSAISKIAKRNNFKISYVMHAGDGNVHPRLIFNNGGAKRVREAQQTVEQICKACVDLGGVLSGEHGVGIEKRDLMNYQFNKQTLETFASLKKMFDPKKLANPGKILPTKLPKKAKAQIKLLPNEKYLLKIIKKQKPIKISSKLTKKLNKILEIDKNNFTITLQSGTKVKDIAKKLKKENLYLPFESKPATLGNILATGDIEGLSRNVLAMDILLSNGKVVSYGAKTVKNATGYDLNKLVLGSRGSLGIILRAIIRIYPKKQSIKKIKLGKNNNYYKDIKNIFDKDNLFI